MEKLYWLTQIQPPDRDWVGEKAFYLSQFIQRGYPVVPGMVVSAQVLRGFLQTITWPDPLFDDLLSSSLHVDVTNPRQLQTIAQQIRQQITDTPLPESWMTTLAEAAQAWPAPAVILRPSVGLKGKPIAHPLQTTGLLEAVVCQPEVNAIATGLKTLWGQLFRAKSLLYWQHQGVRLQQLQLAVLIQPLYPAIASGIVQVDPTRLEIQSTWGLGMALGWGDVTPDLYAVDPETGRIQHQHINLKSLAYSVGGASRHPALGDRAFPGNLGETGLQSFWITAAYQQHKTLNLEHLHALIQLTQALSKEFGTYLTLEWTQIQGAEGPDLFLTQVIPQPLFAERFVSQLEPTIAPETQPESPASPTALAKGLAAAVGQAIAPAFVVQNMTQSLEEMPPKAILVAPFVTPDWLPWLTQVAGIITDDGGMTCHGAILARELGLPAIVGTHQATRTIASGQMILLDGDRGVVYAVSEDSAAEFSPRPPVHLASLSVDMPYPIATQLLVNLSQTSSLPQAQALPVDGVGLLRSELMVLSALDQQHPHKWLQSGHQAEFISRIANQVSQFARAFFPRPVFYRSLDLRSHEFQHLQGGPALKPDANPMLGLRGTLSYQFDPALFDLELAALATVHQSGLTNVNLLLPFVRRVEEFRFCLQRIDQAGLRHSSQFQVWIMAEVPSVLWLLPDYVQAGVQGVSIGSNDLTQLILGIDRDQGQFGAVFDERHPAVMGAIAQIIQTTKQLGIPCSICGQAPANHPELIDTLVRLGVSSISVSLEAVEATYHAIARSEQRLLLDLARSHSLKNSV